MQRPSRPQTAGPRRRSLVWVLVLVLPPGLPSTVPPSATRTKPGAPPFQIDTLSPSIATTPLRTPRGVQDHQFHPKFELKMDPQLKSTVESVSISRSGPIARSGSNSRAGDKLEHTTSPRASCGEHRSKTLTIDGLNFPPRERRRRLAKYGVDEPDQRMFTGYEISEIVRLHEEEDAGFFLIASLLDKDERAVTQAYYEQTLYSETPPHIIDVETYKTGEGEIGENSEDEAAKEEAKENRASSLANAGRPAALSSGRAVTMKRNSAKSKVGQASHDGPTRSTSDGKCRRHNSTANLPSPTTPADLRLPLDHSNLASDIAHPTHPSAPSQIFKNDEMARSSRSRAAHRKPTASPTTPESNCRQTRAAKRAASSSTSSLSGDVDGGNKAAHRSKRLKEDVAEDAASVHSDSLSELSDPPSDLDMDTEMTTPPALPEGGEGTAETEANEAPVQSTQMPRKVVRFAGLDDDDDDDELEDMENTTANTSSNGGATAPDSMDTDAADESGEEPSTAAEPTVEELDRLIFGARPQRLLSMEEISRFIDPRYLRRFNPALRVPAKKKS
ncbi:hypothetical protein Dda_1724 [Drechslerella dactyloides]|uniref:Uncharacterized protein n=1 Tax=Drechslerella dactyloides TaxID=74499 RepID=A0AAD6J2F7_DREDA|nr:hypothetical protein Dda_1724 [Drechslerella dactyloides]